MRPSRRTLTVSIALCGTLLTAGAASGCSQAAAPAPGPEAAMGGPPDPAAARAWLQAISPGPDLQRALDSAVAEVGRRDPKFLASNPRVGAIDLRPSAAPRLAHLRGEAPVYPASVVKFVYLMGAYAFQERGHVTIDAALDRELDDMIRHSSNRATQKVFAGITGTTQGPELDAAAYREFRERRLLVKKWLQSIGIDDLHAVNPTYDGGGDLFGRDQQFIRDREVKGGLPAAGGEYRNRNAMTANGTARLLALLATDRALTAADSETVRRRMKRDIREQPYLAMRVAGGAAAIPGAEAYSKSGTWGPIHADAGIVRAADGRQLVVAVFTEASPPYRGNAIAEITRRLALHAFASKVPSEGESS